MLILFIYFYNWCKKTVETRKELSLCHIFWILIYKPFELNIVDIRSSVSARHIEDLIKYFLLKATHLFFGIFNNLLYNISCFKLRRYIFSFLIEPLVLATNTHCLIPILWYFKIKLFFLAKFIVWDFKVQGMGLRRYKDKK